MPTHLFWLEMFHLVGGGDSGMGGFIRRRQPFIG
jgi:hypothetical protein